MTQAYDVLSSSFIRACKHRPYAVEQIMSEPTFSKTLLNYVNSKQNTAFLVACQYNEESARIIMNSEHSSYVTLNHVGKDGWTPFLAACDVLPALIPDFLRSKHFKPRKTHTNPKMYPINRTTIDGLTGLMLLMIQNSNHVKHILNSSLMSTETLNLSDRDGWTPLMLAIRYKQLDNIKTILSSKYCNKKTIHQNNIDSMTPLMLACKYYDKAVPLLLNSGFYNEDKVLAVNCNDHTALIIACKYSIKAVSHLLDWSGMTSKILGWQSYTGMTAFLCACKHCYGAVSLIMQSQHFTEKIYNAVLSDGACALHLAMDTYSCQQILQSKFCSKEYIKNIDNYGETAFIGAIKAKKVDLVDLFLQSKYFDVEQLKVSNFEHQCALLLAAKCSPECLKKILDSSFMKPGLLTQINPLTDMNLVMFAANYNHTSLKHLLNSKMFSSEILNTVIKNKWTALLYACLNNPESVKEIVNSVYCNSDTVQFKSDDGWTAITCCCLKNSQSLKHLLQSKHCIKSLLNEKCRRNKTPLMIASESVPEATILLLQNGADPGTQDNLGKTFLHYLAKYNSDFIMEASRYIKSVRTFTKRDVTRNTFSDYLKNIELRLWSFNLIDPPDQLCACMSSRYNIDHRCLLNHRYLIFKYLEYTNMKLEKKELIRMLSHFGLALNFNIHHLCVFLICQSYPKFVEDLVNYFV